MKRIFVVCLLAVLLPCCVSAYDFIVDGIYYKVVSEEDRLCKIVSYHEEDDPCSPREVIFIPAKVMNEGKEYTVAIIGEYAFHRINGLLSVVMPVHTARHSICWGLLTPRWVLYSSMVVQPTRLRLVDMQVTVRSLWVAT